MCLFVTFKIPCFSGRVSESSSTPTLGVSSLRRSVVSSPGAAPALLAITAPAGTASLKSMAQEAVVRAGLDANQGHVSTTYVQLTVQPLCGHKITRYRRSALADLDLRSTATVALARAGSCNILTKA